MIAPIKTDNERKRRLLIVDDNIMDLHLISGMFKDEYIIEKAMGGNSALMWLRYYGQAISAVLLDLMMPDMDGFAVLEKMRADARMRLIPAIVVSADEDRESCLKAIRSGASDFITKPVDPDLLRIRVQSAISRCENERLRAENSYLEAQINESLKLRTLLEGTKTVLIEYDAAKNSYFYSPSIFGFVAGNWDARGVCEILKDDGTAAPEDARRLDELISAAIKDENWQKTGMTARLKTPQGETHPFAINVYRQKDETQPCDKLLITMNDLNG